MRYPEIPAETRKHMAAAIRTLCENFTGRSDSYTVERYMKEAGIRDFDGYRLISTLAMPAICYRNLYLRTMNNYKGLKREIRALAEQTETRERAARAAWEPEAVAAALRRRRQALGMSQAQLARVLGVTAPAVSQWEQGRKPTEERLKQLAGALGCTVEALTGRPEDEPTTAGRLMALFEKYNSVTEGLTPEEAGWLGGEGPEDERPLNEEE